MCWLAWQVLFGGTQPFEDRALLVGVIGSAAAIAQPGVVRKMPAMMLAFVAVAVLSSLVHGWAERGERGWDILSPASHHLVMLVFVFGGAYLLRTAERLSAFIVLMTGAIIVLGLQLAFDRAIGNFEYVRGGSVSIPDVAQWGGLHQIGFVLILGMAFPAAAIFEGRAVRVAVAALALVAGLLWIGFLNGSLGGLAVMVLVVGAMAAAKLWRSIPMRWAAGIVAVLVLAALIAVPMMWSRITFVTGGGDIGNRVRIWNAVSQVIRDHPWLGVGPGNYGPAMMSGYHERLLGPAYGGHDQAHNLLLHTAAETGVVGGLLMALVWLSLLGGAWRAWLRGIAPMVSFGFAFVLFGAFARLMTDNLLDGLDTRFRTRVLVWMLFAGAVALTRLEARAVDA